MNEVSFLLLCLPLLILQIVLGIGAFYLFSRSKAEYDRIIDLKSAYTTETGIIKTATQDLKERFERLKKNVYEKLEKKLDFEEGDELLRKEIRRVNSRVSAVQRYTPKEKDVESADEEVQSEDYYDPSQEGATAQSEPSTNGLADPEFGKVY